MKKMTIEEKLYLSCNKAHNVSHIKILDEEVCNKRCKTKICTVICPAKSYEKNGDENIVFHYENCLECGSCRIICPENNIEWHYPVFGKGVFFKYG